MLVATNTCMTSFSNYGYTPADYNYALLSLFAGHVDPKADAYPYVMNISGHCSDGVPLAANRLRQT